MTMGHWSHQVTCHLLVSSFYILTRRKYFLRIVAIYSLKENSYDYSSSGILIFCQLDYYCIQLHALKTCEIVTDLEAKNGNTGEVNLKQCLHSW